MSGFNVCNVAVLGAGDMAAQIAAPWVNVNGPAKRFFNKSSNPLEGVCNG